MSSRVSIGGIGAILDFGEDKTTQIFRNLATSDLIFTTVSTKRLVIFANGNVGIGTSFPETKLHVYDDINTTTSLLIHNNNIIYAAPPVIVSTPAANMSGTITGSIDKYMIFTAGTYNFTVPPGGINCDILMIGGGGAGGAGGGGGGAGACIIAIGQTLTVSATISVTVGNGGSTGAVAGGSSIITEDGNTKYNAMGGGRGATGSDSGNNGGCGGGGGFGDGTPRTGGINVGTNIVNGFSTGPIITTNYAVLGSRGGNQIETNVTIAGAYCTPGGGGIGGAGADHLSGVQAGGVGGPGLNQVTIGSYIYNFKSYFANDGSFGQNNGYIGGGGGGTSLFTSGIASGGSGGGGFGTGTGYTIPISGFDNTGSGGGGRTINGGGSGGSGIVIIRYRSTIPSPSSSSIELLRGITGDTKTDYKIGNYEGDFKIISSTSGINTDRLVINQNGNLGIGTITSTSKLYLYDDITNVSKLTLHNNMPINTLTSSPLATTTGYTSNYTYKVFTYTTETVGTGSGQTLYTINVPSGGIICDILMVGGGGIGGMDIGAGGGGGAVLYGSNINIASGVYNIKVGNGAIPGDVRGKSTEGFGATILGGGSAGNMVWDNRQLQTIANSGGSGSGGKSRNIQGDISGGGVGISTKGSLLANAILYNGNVGGSGTFTLISGAQSGGGGGAGAVGGNGNGNSMQTGNGGNGVLINITGINYYWGGGGGAGSADSIPTSGGLGGGGAGINKNLDDATTYGVVGGSSYTLPILMNGGQHTGGGGGGSGWNSPIAGNGGSGIIIIKYLSSSSSIELIRGSITDNNTDYKIGNYDGDFKIISLTSGINTDALVINQSSNITFGGNVTAASFFGDGKLLSGIVQSQWSSSNNSIYYNTSNVGIGTGNPDSKLHMYDDAAIYTNLLIHNNNLGITAITSYPEATVNGTISNSTDKFMIFTSGSYNLTIPIGGIICDILMIGGGGGGGGEFGVSGGGGAGACIVAINQNFEQGMYVVTVGNGSPGNGPTPNLGGDSIISVNNSTMYRAKGGGGSSLSYGSGVSGGCGSGAGYDISYGGYPANTNVVRGVTTGPIVTATYGVYGNKGGDQQQVGDGAAPSSLNRAGGGGIGWPGRDHTNFGLTCGDGGDGTYRVIINGNLYNFRSYFANDGNNFGVNDGNGNYYIGGGGGGGSENVRDGNYTGAGGLGGGSGQRFVNAIANTGSGGSGYSSLGGSGIVIIRYKNKSANISLNSSIELKRGSATDSNTDYKIGNYDGDFKIISSTSGIITDKLIINKNGNVGIGTNLPSNNLDIYDDVNTSTSLLIQNNNVGMVTTAAATIISSPAAWGGSITNSIDKFLIFSSGTYTLTVPSGGINCDILMIGGGGGGGFGGGGGAGACIVAINQILTSNNGNYTVFVGAGAVAESTSNGDDSTISVNNTTMYRAKGGGTVSNNLGSDGGCGSGSGFDISSGGNPLNTNVVAGVTTGPIVTAAYAVLGSKGGNQLQSFSGNKTGGGGIGGAGYDHIVGGPPSNGGPGLNAVTINNMPYNFKNYFANGVDAFGVDGYIGGGGGGGSDIGQPPSSGGIGGGGNGNSFLSAISNTGSGGGSFEADGDFTGGGSGIVIIRYRSIHTIIPTNASIKLIRGYANDSKTDYQIGNYNGDFKIISSTTGINTDALVINQNGNVGIGTITPTSKLYLYDDITNVSKLTLHNNFTASNAITSSSIELIRGSITDNNTDYKIGNYNGDFKIITSTSGINTDAFVINQTSNITINGNIGIGTNSPTNILQVGNGGRLRIANDNTGFTCLGTHDAFGSSNTSIVLSGINRTGAIGNIEYFARSTGIHAFYTGSGTSIERLCIASNGNVGIGTVDTAAYKLNVNGSINAASFFGDGNGISGVLLTSNDTNLSNYVLSTSNTLANRITNLVTDNITETINSKNKFIVNDRYNNNLLVNGTLTINSNLVVLGESTRLETIVYTTERLEVINENTTSVAMKIQQKDIYTDIFNASNLNSMVFTIANNGDVNISGKYKINNRDIDANISNYVLSTSNILVDRIRTEVGFGSNYSVRLDSNISNYVLSTSNILVDRIRTEVGFGSNYSVRLDSNISNYVISTSNILVDRIRTEVGFGSNYSVRLDSNISNYVLSSSNILVDRIRTEVGFGSNYSVRLDSNISNYVLSTSNTLVDRIRTEVGFGSNYSLRLDSNISNYVLSTSNTLVARIGTGGGGSSQWTTYNNMIYYNTSNVGIGTTIPQRNLHVQNGMRIGGTNAFLDFGDDATMQIYRNTTTNEMIFTTASLQRMKIWSVGAVGIQNNGYALANNQMAAGSLTIGNQDQNYGGGTNWTANTAGLLMECADNTEIAVHDAGNSIHSFMRYTTNGLFTIGRNMGYGAATVNFGADINVTGNITAYYSDKRLKTKTRNIEDPLKIINELEGFYYTPNELAHSVGITNTREEIGLSAQDVQKILPELISLAPFDLEKDKDGKKVSKSGDNYLTMSYERLIPVLVEAIKELNKEIKLFKNENIELKDRYKKLLEEIISIKQTIKLI